MPEIHKWSIYKYEYAHHASCVYQQLVELFFWLQGRVQKDVIEKVSSDLWYKQGNNKLDNASNSSNDTDAILLGIITYCLFHAFYAGRKLWIWYTHNGVNRSISSYYRPLNKGMVGLCIDNDRHEPLVFWGDLPYWNWSIMPHWIIETLLEKQHTI